MISFWVIQIWTGVAGSSDQLHELESKGTRLRSATEVQNDLELALKGIQCLGRV